MTSATASTLPGAFNTMLSLSDEQGAAGVVGVLVAYVLTLGPLLQTTIHWPLGARITLAISALLPMALIMGMPFPLGIRQLHRCSRDQVPWAWGVNGCLSVVAAAFATLIAVETGYRLLLLLAAGAYLLASLFGLRSAVEKHR